MREKLVKETLGKRLSRLSREVDPPVAPEPSLEERAEKRYKGIIDGLEARLEKIASDPNRKGKSFSIFSDFVSSDSQIFELVVKKLEKYCTDNDLSFRKGWSGGGWEWYEHFVVTWK